METSMATVLSRPQRVNRAKATAPCEPAANVNSLADLVKHTATLADTDPAAWCYQQVQYHDHYRDGASQIASVALSDLYCVLSPHSAPRVSVAEVAANPDTIYKGLSLLTLDFPRASRRSVLADQLDEQALCYSEMGSSVARLAALVVLWYAEGCEHHTAQTADEYWDREDAWQESLRREIPNRYTGKHEPDSIDDLPFLG
jgi:hypothetical protein